MEVYSARKKWVNPYYQFTMDKTRDPKQSNKKDPSQLDYAGALADAMESDIYENRDEPRPPKEETSKE